MNSESFYRGLLPGIGASTAYLLAMSLDMRLTGRPYDDRVLWGGLLVRNPAGQKVLGIASHYAVGELVAAGYEAVDDRLPALPPALKGLVWIALEHFGGFSGNIVLDRIHPDVRAGRLPKLMTWRYFWLATVRHAAFGIVLGLLSEWQRNHR